MIAAEMQNDRGFWFKMCGGDKDTFRWAFRILGLEWSDSPVFMGIAGYHNEFENGDFCGQ